VIVVTKFGHQTNPCSEMGVVLGKVFQIGATTAGPSQLSYLN
jgi:hypothetical protein